MAADNFDDILDLEQNFYQEGYRAGLADGHTAGLIEGRIFGIERGFEKALEMGRLYGRATVWNKRLPSEASLSAIKRCPQAEAEKIVDSRDAPNTKRNSPLGSAVANLSEISDNARLRRHIEALLTLTDVASLSADNDDQAVADFEDRIARAVAKARVVSQIVGEPFSTVKETAGIEESKGLSARH